MNLETSILNHNSLIKAKLSGSALDLVLVLEKSFVDGDMSLNDLLKAHKDLTKLVKKKQLVTRNGKTYLMTVYVNPDGSIDKEEHHKDIEHIPHLEDKIMHGDLVKITKNDGSIVFGKIKNMAGLGTGRAAFTIVDSNNKDVVINPHNVSKIEKEKSNKENNKIDLALSKNIDNVIKEANIAWMTEGQCGLFAKTISDSLEGSKVMGLIDLNYGDKPTVTHYFVQYKEVNFDAEGVHDIKDLERDYNAIVTDIDPTTGVPKGKVEDDFMDFPDYSNMKAVELEELLKKIKLIDDSNLTKKPTIYDRPEMESPVWSIFINGKEKFIQSYQTTGLATAWAEVKGSKSKGWTAVKHFSTYPFEERIGDTKQEAVDFLKNKYKQLIQNEYKLTYFLKINGKNRINSLKSSYVCFIN